MLVSLGFAVSSDDPATDASSCIPVATGLQIHGSSTIAKLDALDELYADIAEALAQPVDGNDRTEWTIYGGRSTGGDIVVEFARAAGLDRSLDTVSIMGLAGWKRVKSEFFQLGLVQYGFVPAP